MYTSVLGLILRGVKPPKSAVDEPAREVPTVDELALEELAKDEPVLAEPAVN